MKPIVNAGVVLGGAVVVWQLVHGFAGLYRNPSMGWVFPVVATLIEIGVLVWGLRQTAELGRGYGGQVGAGVLMALIGGVIILVGGWIEGTFIFTDMAEVIAGMQADQYADMGMDAEKIDQMIAATAFARTPIFGAFMGFIATIVTGLVISLIAAIWVRNKEA